MGNHLGIRQLPFIYQFGAQLKVIFSEGGGGMPPPPSHVFRSLGGTPPCNKKARAVRLAMGALYWLGT